VDSLNLAAVFVPSPRHENAGNLGDHARFALELSPLPGI
jgi:hypothetical protein